MSIYADYRKAVGFLTPVEPDFFLVGSLFVSAVALTYVGLFIDLMLGALISVLVFDLALGYPLYRRAQRITKIERSLPDVMSHMGTTLRAGGTIESALKEVSRGNYGPITDELKTMMREISEGKTFDEAFQDFASRTESIDVMRSVNVIVSAKRTGGGLVSALSSIAEDMRENGRIKLERQSHTMTQVLFIVVAACFVAPFIFGLVSGIILFLGSIGGGEMPPLFETMMFYFKGFLVLSAIFASLAASMIREGNVTKTVIYAPILLVITYVIFIGVNTFARTFFVP
jgi:pilus assembly protein TadC